MIDRDMIYMMECDTIYVRPFFFFFKRLQLESFLSKQLHFKSFLLKRLKLESL
jgi:hypothetical protein